MFKLTALIASISLFGCSVNSSDQTVENKTSTNQSSKVCITHSTSDIQLPEGSKFHCAGYRYDLLIDPCFSAQEREKVLLYWSRWVAIIGSNISYTVETIANDNSSLDSCQIKIYKRYAPPGYFGWTIGWFEGNGKPTAAQVLINPDLDLAPMELVAGHELGHALSMSHSSEAGNIMDPSIPTVPGRITCQNQIDLCNIWGCSPSCI